MVSPSLFPFVSIGVYFLGFWAYLKYLQRVFGVLFQFGDGGEGRKQEKSREDFLFARWNEIWESLTK